MIRWFAVSCVILAAFQANPARGANDEEPAPVESSPPRHTAVYAVMGLGTPIGFVGFEGVHRVGKRLELSAGFGRGLLAMGSQAHASPIHDIQWAVMPRWRIGDRRHALTLGAGASGGNTGGGGEWFCENGPCPKRDYPLTYVFWANFEVGAEHWWNGGFAMRWFVGWARGCSTSTCTSSTGAQLSLPYAGMGFGYAF